VPIPKRLVRTVPEQTAPHTESLWETACRMHPDWAHVTWRDPVPRNQFPLTAPFWDECESGAQLADLIRAEDLYHRGGWYIDSDVEILKPFDQLCVHDAVAGWEDHLHIPNAVLGFTAGHPALLEVIELAVERRSRGTWLAGVGVTTEVFKRHDMLLLPPGSFYPVHWRDAHRGFTDWRQAAKDNPWAYCLHRYAASWHH
jgi:mannosyltransferase OCH1-like enzyme